MDRNFYLFSFFMVSFILTACHFFDKKEKELSETEKVLQDPAFAGITDSIKLLPQSAELYEQRAQMLSQRGFHDIAYYDYKKAWELQPQEAYAISYVSNLFLTSKIEAAVDFLKECIKKFPDNRDFKRRLGEAYIQNGQATEAIALFDEVLQKDSTDFETWYEKGLLLSQLKDTANAISALERSYELQPIQMSGLALANLYAETQNPKVLPLCDALLAKDSVEQAPDPIFLKGVYYSNLHQYRKAIEQFDHCIKIDWKFIEAYIEKGIILYEQNNMKEALRIFQLAATVSNTYPDAYYWMGRCFEKMNDKQQAVDNYIRALSLDKNFVEAQQALQRLKTDHTTE